MKINIKYIIAFFILLAIETYIGLFVRDAIIRPYVGDILVVVLLYTLARGLWRKPIRVLPVYVFVFAAAVELAQYFGIAEILQLEDNRLIYTIIGGTFDMKDILCYLAGALLLVAWENICRYAGGEGKA